MANILFIVLEATTMISRGINILRYEFFYLMRVIIWLYHKHNVCVSLGIQIKIAKIRKVSVAGEIRM